MSADSLTLQLQKIWKNEYHTHFRQLLETVPLWRTRSQEDSMQKLQKFNYMQWDLRGHNKKVTEGQSNVLPLGKMAEKLRYLLEGDQGK